MRVAMGAAMSTRRNLPNSPVTFLVALALAACGGAEREEVVPLEDHGAASVRAPGVLAPPENPRLASNPTLPDVVAAFGQIPTQGTRMGFRSGPLTGSEILGGSTSHWQGVGRLPRSNHLVATSNIRGELWVVQMGSRSGTGRWSSNRPSGGNPPTSDTLVRLADGAANARVGFGAYTHAGGLSVIGDYVVLGIEREGDEDGDGVVRLFDLGAPTRPRSVWGFSHEPSTAGALAIVRLPSGYYLLAVGGWGSETLDFYYSTTTDLEDPGFRHLRHWSRSECVNRVAGDGTCFASHQNLGFVLQSDGRLFLLGTNRSSSGEDWIDLLEVTGLPQGPTDSLAGLVVTKIAKRHLTCTDGCSFKAAAGVYVDGARLVVYATEMRRRAGDASIGAWTRFNEF